MSKKRKPVTKIHPKKFAAEYIKNNKNGTRAVQAIDKQADFGTASVRASRMLKDVKVQQAIEEALIKHEVTAEHAIKKVKAVSDMELDSKSASSILKASNLILELHGWRKDERPTTTLNIKNAFFKPRDTEPLPIDNRGE